MGHVICVLDNVMSCSVALECGALGHVGYVLDNVVLCSMLCGACGLWAGQCSTMQFVALHTVWGM